MPRPFLTRLCAAVLLLAGPLADDAHPGKLTLKSGQTIEGTPVNVPGLNPKTSASNLSQNVPQTPYWLVDDGIRRYFVHRQNLVSGPEGVDQSDESSRYMRFRVPKIKAPRPGKESIPTWVGSFVETTPWDEHGRCRVTLRTPSRLEPVHLAITLLDPRYLKVESTSHVWDFGLTPTAVPVETLTKILHSTIDPRNPDERMGVVRFFLQSQQYHGARAELEAMQQEFPDLEARLKEMQAELFNLNGQQALSEIHDRRAIGQHMLSRYVAQRIFQEDFTPETLREAQAFLDEYVAADRRMAEARMLLSSVQAALPPEAAAQVGAIRATIELELNYDTLPRLEPFLNVAADPVLPATEKLALAYSGWLLGPAHAKTSYQEAVALWEARHLVLEYLLPGADRGDRHLLRKKLEPLEGVSVPVIARMIPQLPTPMEYPSLPTATTYTFDLEPTLDSEIPVRYGVLVPPEYTPTRAYPAVVVLRPEGYTIEQALAMWGGTPDKPGAAQRRGYIVIAPEYAAPTAGTYDYGQTAHETVVRALNDARQRLHMDSDRVFLAGHGMGADAAFDIGLAHPDLWAGVMPICGQFQHAAYLMRNNAPKLSFYVIGGERDRGTLDTNAFGMAARMQRGWDFVYCEYKQRGYELYLEELPRLFEWMALRRRSRSLKELEHNFIQAFNNRVSWLRWTDLPPALSQPIVWGEGRTPKVFSVEATVPTQETLFIRQPGKHTVLWLSPEMVDYDKVLKVRVNSTTKYRDYPVPELGTLLDDLRERGDRQMLFWTRLAF